MPLFSTLQIQVLPKVIWEKGVADDHTKNPIPYNGMPHIHPKSAPSTSTTSTPIYSKLTPPTIPNCIRIQSAVLSQYTSQTDRPTGGIGDKPVPTVLTLTLYG